MACIFPSFAPAIRDYIDVLNNAYDSVSNTSDLQQILQQSILYFASSIKFVVIYFLSFQWIQDLTYLPIVLPQIKLEILKEHFFFDTPQSNFFTFLETPSYTYNKFFLGLTNSFFLCLPLSIAHIISVRRLLIQGLAAGISSSFGTISGQILILICIFFGGRFFITPWFNFQILNYFIGTWLVLTVCYDMITERSIRVIDSSNTTALRKIFFINFILAWTEQSCIFQYFGNLTLGAEPSIIEIFSSGSSLQSVLVHINYILGILVGSILFTSLFIFTTLKFSNFSVTVLDILYSRWIRTVNLSLILVILIFAFTSIPFYSFEYLVLSNLGFSPQDKSLKNTNTVFSYTKIHDLPRPILGNEDENIIGIATDVTRFNKGRYLMFDPNDSFEQLNYKGEYDWFTKRSRLRDITLDVSRNPTLSKVAKFFNKGKKKQFKKKKFAESKTVVGYDNTAVPDLYQDNSANKRFAFRNESTDMINQSFEGLVNTSASQRFFISNEMRLTNLENNFKQKYYSNPLYKLLLSADIDFFLKRQPTSFLLSPKQEHELFKKRTVLSNYYDSLRYYNNLPYASEFQYFFNGSKSYADRIYNHQFNGTLKIVRRLFSINIDLNNQFPIKDFDQKQTLASSGLEQTEQPGKKQILSGAPQNKIKFLEKDTNNFILKFDQPLYKKINTLDYLNLPFHEELNPGSFGPKSRGSNESLLSKNNSSTLQQNPGQADQPKSKEEKVSTNKTTSMTGSPDPKFSSENNIANSEPLLSKPILSKQSNKPFLELINPMPFYVGWDEQLRKLVITNRLSPNYCAGECMKFTKSDDSKDLGLKDSTSGTLNSSSVLESDKNEIRKITQSESPEDSGNLSSLEQAKQTKSSRFGPKTSKNYSNEYLTLNKLIKKNKTINFTAWPILYNPNFQTYQTGIYKPEMKNKTSYNLLFDSLRTEENKLKLQNLIQNDPNLNRLLSGGYMRDYGELSSLPINVLTNGGRGNRRIAGGELKDIIPYNRGGFVWPGHSDLKFKFKESSS